MTTDPQNRPLPDEITPLVDRLKAVLDAPPGHHVFSTTVDADLLREAIDELARLKRYTKAEYRLVSADGGIAISFPVHERDARERALEWHEWHPAYAVELVTAECWGTDWETVETQAVTA